MNRQKMSPVSPLFEALAVLCLLSCQMDMDILGYRWQKTDPYNTAAYPALKKRTGDDFRIMLLTDTQLCYFSNSDAPEKSFSAIPETLAMITEAVTFHRPDLLVLPGDNIAGAGFFNAIEAERLIVFLDSFKIPYAPVMGNHDGEGYFTLNDDNRKAVIAKIFDKGRYSLFQNGPDNLGAGNYGVHITDDNGTFVYSLIMLDNGFQGGYFSAAQVEWYQWFVRGISAARYGGVYSPPGNVVPSIAFFHIALPETKDLKEELKTVNPVLAAWCIREGPTGGNVPNHGMFAAMKALRSTTHLCFGHDHKNILNYDYQGIRFVYGLKTGISAYHDKDRTGVTLITINDTGTVKVSFYDRRGILLSISDP